MRKFSLAPQIGRKSVRAADRENSVGDPLIPPAAEMPGEGRAVDWKVLPSRDDFELVRLFLFD